MTDMSELAVSGVVADILPPISTTQRRSRAQSQRRSSRSASSALDPTRSVKPCRTAAPRAFSLTSTSLSVRFPPDVPSAASSVWNHGERGARRCAGERCGRNGKISPAQVRALRGRTARSLSGLRRTLLRSARPRRTAEPRHAKFIAPLAERTYPPACSPEPVRPAGPAYRSERHLNGRSVRLAAADDK